MEAKLVDVEAEAAILVVNVDIDGMDPEMRAWWLRGGGTGGHGLDYTAWGGSGEKDNAQARSARGRAEEEGENRSFAPLGMTGLGNDSVPGTRPPRS
jgi:hypothetical protein